MNPAGDIEQLIALMARLPGLGPRSARRAVLHLLGRKAQLMQPIATQMAALAQNVRACVRCRNFTTQDLCEICADPKRNNGSLCVVETVADLWAMERAGVFTGQYHVLGGVLSALEGVGPEDLQIPALLERARDGVAEVILALNATMEGQTTAHYIADQLAGSGVTLSSLAQGVPMGGELDYLDDGTLMTAMKARRSL